MQFLGWLVQIALIVSWYVVPAMATVPWYVIFLPLLISAGILGLVLLGFLMFGLIALVANR